MQGAGDSGGIVLGLAVAWISVLWSITMLLTVPRDYGRLSLGLVYSLFVLQIACLARHLGSYPILSALFFPLPLAYYCSIFGLTAARRVFGRKTVWRGREV